TARALLATSRPLVRRAQGRPGACCTRGLACELRYRKCTRAYRAAGAFRPSLRNGFTAYFVLFPENGSFASVAPRSFRSLRTSRQHRGARTTRLHRTLELHTSVAALASIASHRAFVTMANAPHPPRDGRFYAGDLREKDRKSVV